jgi:hypothetical protein
VQVIIEEKSITLLKIMKVNGKYVGVRQPINCATGINFIIQQHNYEEENVQLLHTFSLHSFLHTSTETLTNVLPLGKLRTNQLKTFLEIHPIIQYIHRNLVHKQNILYPCHVHPIVTNINKLYGMSLMTKAVPKIIGKFNKYKKILV